MVEKKAKKVAVEKKKKIATQKISAKAGVKKIKTTTKKLPVKKNKVVDDNQQKTQAPLFMVAQLPFNSVETVKLNTPMIEIMDDGGNVGIATANLKELKQYANILKPTTRFLEIGCGSGYLLESLASHGKGLYFGIEPIPSEAKKAKERMAGFEKRNTATLTKYFSSGKMPKGRLIASKLIEKAKFPANSLDYIYSYHVFEHLVNPLVMFELAQKWLKSDGKLIITCPNVESMMAMHDLDRWRCSLSSHRWLPGKSTIIRAAERCGFAVDRYFTYGGHASPRPFVKDVLNWVYKKINLGDVICIMLTKKQ